MNGKNDQDIMNHDPESFSGMLIKAGLELTRDKTTVLQVNTGLLCNQACRHCHLSAGPGRPELMKRDTIKDIRDFASRHDFEMIDITGGAVELNPDILHIVTEFAGCAPRMMLRSNLTALLETDSVQLLGILKENKVAITASFPSLNEKQSDSQRGQGIFRKSVDMIKALNGLGYGKPGSGLELNLVTNPSGAFMPVCQKQAEDRFRHVLSTKWGIEFSRVFSFANVPLGRFRAWLEKTGNYVDYLKTLKSAFNPSSVKGVMCRNLISVDWDGYLYDCDFNLAADLPMGRQKRHISEITAIPSCGDRIETDDHCFACTAGSGFT